MIDFWGGELVAGAEHEFKVYVINDLYSFWEGTVRFCIMRGEQIVAEQSGSCGVKGLGRQVVSFTQTIPNEVGEYQLVVELGAVGGKKVRSFRDFNVVLAE